MFVSEGVEEACDSLSRSPIRVKDGQDSGFDVQTLIVEDCRGECLLAGEVCVKRPLRHAGGVGDVLDPAGGPRRRRRRTSGFGGRGTFSMIVDRSLMTWGDTMRCCRKNGEYGHTDQRRAPPRAVRLARPRSRDGAFRRHAGMASAADDRIGRRATHEPPHLTRAERRSGAISFQPVAGTGAVADRQPLDLAHSNAGVIDAPADKAFAVGGKTNG